VSLVFSAVQSRLSVMTVAVLRQIWKPRKTGPVAVLQKFLALDGKHGAAIPVCILVQFAGDLDAGAE